MASECFSRRERYKERSRKVWALTCKSIKECSKRVEPLYLHFWVNAANNHKRKNFCGHYFFIEIFLIGVRERGGNCFSCLQKKEEVMLYRSSI
jgi:hypothetical protein